MELNIKIYIPVNLEDCIRNLKELLSEEDKNIILKWKEEECCKLHFSLGMWLRNNWGLWEDSHLSKWFNENGVKHADDMSSIIITSFWRDMHNKPIKLDEQIKFYQDYWKNAGVEL